MPDAPETDAAERVAQETPETGDPVDVSPNAPSMDRRAGTEKRPRQLLREYRSFLIFAVLMLVFRSAWADWVRVPTPSMNPTILEGDRVLVDKHVYGLRVPWTLIRITPGRDPERGEIVVFDSPADGISLVKRVVGVGGDEVVLDNGRLIVNGQRAGYREGDAQKLRTLLEEMAALQPRILREAGFGPEHDILLLPHRAPRGVIGPIRVPDDMYFVLGDNRDNSGDSRYFGFVPRRNIVGRATRVVVSLDPGNHYLPRLSRTLVELH